MYGLHLTCSRVLAACAAQDALQAEDPEHAVQAVKTVKVGEARAAVEEARLVNDLRSGARGNEARQRLLDLEAR